MLALVAIVAALAHPAAPARNGLVAFDRCCGLASTGIYTIRQNGTGQRRIFRPLADDAPLTPAWSPNGQADRVRPRLADRRPLGDERERNRPPPHRPRQR